MTVPLVPPPGKIIIRKDEPKAKTDSGIILGKNDRQKSFTGTIVAGNGTYHDGQKIVFQARVSNSFNFRDENLILIGEDDIFAIL